MSSDSHTGQVIILNGTPRSGKTTIAKLIQAEFDGPWMDLGLDTYVRAATPERYRPGIALEPGATREDLEELIPLFYAALYESIAMHSAFGLNVVADLCHHDDYSRPLGILPDCARRLEDLPVLFVGVRCPTDVLKTRQDGDDRTVGDLARWEEAVHQPGLYDLEVDTSQLTPAECVAAIRRQLEAGIPQPSAFQRLTEQHLTPAPLALDE